jgi:acetylornithine deacetylase/succinyl-diaminopimelate desuccinylase-like protein
MPDSVVSFLADLVAIDSVNPSLASGARGEEHIARRIAAELDAIGCAIEVTYVAPDRPNIVGLLNGRAPGRTLMLCGHTDTVGVDGMTNPFGAEIRDGKLYGRGAQDMKGGLAAMIGAARRIVEGGGLEKGRLLIAAVADEEHASLGADALVQRWRADAAVVTEPTGLDVAVCHKGFQWVCVETRGTAAHGSRPDEGRDAILRMGRFLHRLESHERQVQRGRAHPLLGTASLHASLVDGGHELSSYPRRARLIFERRTLPGEPNDVALTEANAILGALRDDDREFDGEASPIFGRGGYEIDAAHPLPDMLVQAAARVGASPSRVGMTFWTDAAILGAAGIPSVLFGPGGAGLHSREEYVYVEDVCRCRDALVELVRMFT